MRSILAATNSKLIESNIDGVCFAPHPGEQWHDCETPKVADDSVQSDFAMHAAVYRVSGSEVYRSVRGDNHNTSSVWTSGLIVQSRFEFTAQSRNQIQSIYYLSKHLHPHWPQSSDNSSPSIPISAICPDLGVCERHSRDSDLMNNSPLQE